MLPNTPQASFTYKIRPGQVLPLSIQNCRHLGLTNPFADERMLETASRINDAYSEFLRNKPDGKRLEKARQNALDTLQSVSLYLLDHEPEKTARHIAEAISAIYYMEKVPESAAQILVQHLPESRYFFRISVSCCGCPVGILKIGHQETLQGMPVIWQDSYNTSQFDRMLLPIFALDTLDVVLNGVMRAFGITKQ